MLSKHIYHSVLQPTFYMGLSKQTLNSLRERLYRIYSCILHAHMLSGSVMSNSLRPHKLQHNRLPSPSLSPGAYSNSYLLSQQCIPTILSSVIFPSPPAFYLSQHQGLFQWVDSSHQVTWYKVFSFSISPSNKYSGLISFRIDWFDLLAVQGTLKSLLQHHSSKASILRCSAFFTVQLSHATWLLEKP